VTAGVPGEIVYVSIGNSDDRLSQSHWSGFAREVQAVVRRHAKAVVGEWYSLPDSPYQNACFAFAPGDIGKAAYMQFQLSEIARPVTNRNPSPGHAARKRKCCHDLPLDDRFGVAAAA
jgi:hypothetical protein